MILLDTGFLIRALVRDTREDRRLLEWLRGGETMGMSVVGWTEFLCGPVGDAELDLAARVVTERLPLVEEDAATAARLFNETGRKRGTLVDCTIAATSLRLGAPLATTNVKDFSRFVPAGLTLAD